MLNFELLYEHEAAQKRSIATTTYALLVVRFERLHESRNIWSLEVVGNASEDGQAKVPNNALLMRGRCNWFGGLKARTSDCAIENSVDGRIPLVCAKMRPDRPVGAPGNACERS